MVASAIAIISGLPKAYFAVYNQTAVTVTLLPSLNVQNQTSLLF